MIDAIFKNMSLAWPSILLGALIPCGVLLVLSLTKKHKEVSYKAVLYGFATFFMALGAVLALLFLVGDSLIPSISTGDQESSTKYINLLGTLILFFFYLVAEGIKYLTFTNIVKQDKNKLGGLLFGCGFILAQNGLIFGVVYFGKADLKQSFGFGVLMLISAAIYLLISEIGYQLVLDHHRIVGSILAISYYLMFAVMLLFANVYITYAFICAVLLFNLVMGYIILPHPFKRTKGENT